MSPILTVEDLTKRYVADAPAVVDGVGFSIEPGEVFVLLGPSGCGKTTTLRLIAGFERPERGTVRLDGRTLTGNGAFLPPDQRDVGMVFQDYALFPHLSVLQNVLYGLKRMPRHKRRERAEHVLKLVGLINVKDRKPHELSGGQQQRIAVARSIAPAPRLILLDEPFSNLDAAMRSQTRLEVRSLLEREGMTALLVTHDQEEALSFGDRIAVMQDGRIEQVGRPEQVYRRPATPFVAQFLGRTNLLRVEAQGVVAQTPLGPVRLDRPAQGEVMVSMRPEHLRLEPPQPGFASGEILSRQYKGHDLTLQVRVQQRTYEVQTNYRCPFLPGEHVRIVPMENAVVLGETEGD